MSEVARGVPCTYVDTLWTLNARQGCPVEICGLYRVIEWTSATVSLIILLSPIEKYFAGTKK